MAQATNPGRDLVMPPASADPASAKAHHPQQRPVETRPEGRTGLSCRQVFQEVLQVVDRVFLPFLCRGRQWGNTMVFLPGQGHDRGRDCRRLVSLSALHPALALRGEAMLHSRCTLLPPSPAFLSLRFLAFNLFTALLRTPPPPPPPS